MTTGEFIAAAVIAIYAMLGSALFGAAITKPDNALRAIEAMKFYTWLFGSLALLLSAVAWGAVAFVAPAAPQALGNISSAIAAGQWALLAILYASRWIARQLLPEK